MSPSGGILAPGRLRDKRGLRPPAAATRLEAKSCHEVDAPLQVKPRVNDDHRHGERFHPVLHHLEHLYAGLGEPIARVGQSPSRDLFRGRHAHGNEANIEADRKPDKAAAVSALEVRRIDDRMLIPAENDSRPLLNQPEHSPALVR